MTEEEVNELAQEIVDALPSASTNPEGWDYFVAVRDVLTARLGREGD